MNSIVYHASSISDLKILNPTVSSHGRAYVYATKELVASACFLRAKYNGGDFAYWIGRDQASKKFAICERYKGAFLEVFDVPGTIYVLDAGPFKADQTCWEEEVVSEVSVVPVRKIVIDNNAEYLRQLSDDGSLIIKFYNEKLPQIPDDDEDLVFRALIWKDAGDTIDKCKMWHPHLVKRIDILLKDEDSFLASIDRWMEISGKEFVSTSLAKTFPKIWRKYHDAE